MNLKTRTVCKDCHYKNFSPCPALGTSTGRKNRNDITCRAWVPDKEDAIWP